MAAIGPQVQAEAALRLTQAVFGRRPIPAELPPEMNEVTSELRKTVTKEECLWEAVRILSERYRGYRFRTYTRVFDLWTSDPERLWAKQGFLHCTNVNYLCRILLVGSGHFRDGEIEQRWTAVYWISPHQYLRVRLDEGRWVEVDLWGLHYGIPLGGHARGFNLSLKQTKPRV